MIQSQLIPTYGGKLVSLVVPVEEREELRASASALPSIRISERSACDLELLACGAFSPLDHFVTQSAREMRAHDVAIKQCGLPAMFQQQLHQDLCSR